MATARNVWLWHLGAWFDGHGGVGLLVGLCDLSRLLQLKQLRGSVSVPSCLGREHAEDAASMMENRSGLSPASLQLLAVPAWSLLTSRL